MGLIIFLFEPHVSISIVNARLITHLFDLAYPKAPQQIHPPVYDFEFQMDLIWPNSIVLVHH